VRLDRKLLLIAPAIVLALVVAGMVYTAVELHVLARSSDTFVARKEFVDQAARGEKPLDQRQAINILQIALEVEGRRSAAILASRDLLIELSAVALVAWVALVIGIRGVPRQHWPRFGRASTSAPGASPAPQAASSDNG
jgi:hypothetical protein